MDFIRAAIKSLFYKFPIDRAAQCVVSSMGDALFIDGLKEVLRWDNQQFTSTEVGILEDVITQTWMKPYKRSSSTDGIPMTGRSLFVLSHFGNDLFDTSSWSRPVVHYDHLLRWRDIAHHVGEDILTTSFLAEQDSVRMFSRNSFAWENVIRHNNKALNKVLDNGLSEVHSHINAATDVFELNWLRVMNEVSQDMTTKKPQKQQQLGLKDYRQDYSPAPWDNTSTLTLYDWGIVAAAIRTWIYRTVMRGECISDMGLKQLKDMMTDTSHTYAQEEDVKATIGTFEADAYRLPNGLVFDYAITSQSASMCNKEDIWQPYFVHQGERELMYRYFRMLTENVDKASVLAPYVYLYILIKNNYRREFVQTNPLNGFENFQRYQKRKALYLDKQEINSRVNFRYAVQTSLRDIDGERLEARLAPEQVGKRQKTDYRESIFIRELFYQKGASDGDLTFVVHFLKTPDKNLGEGESRHAAYRNYLQTQMRNVVSLCKDKPVDSDVRLTKIVGIDAAGSELDCRPEVFAPSFRYAQMSGLSNITYHAGEDFYDLADGLRTIDEVMLFMNYQRGCRIGHALALGIESHSYYEWRHRNTIMPRQVMLDNLVWMYYKARQMNVELHPETLDFIDQNTHTLYQEIGYEGEFDQFIYWQSMLLRGDAPDSSGEAVQELTTQERAARCHHPLCDAARLNARARTLRLQYDCSKVVKEQGGKPCLFVLPKSFELDIEALQDKMMDEIERRDICIECNPTSNLKIGPFERYDELPLWRFHNVGQPKRHSMNVSINTDDKGVFATSLYNEYSVISLAMLKRKDKEGKPLWTPKEVMDYIEQLVTMGHSQRFEPVKVWLAE